MCLSIVIIEQQKKLKRKKTCNFDRNTIKQINLENVKNNKKETEKSRS